MGGNRICARLSFYFIDPEIGFLHGKLQTWLPFSIQVYLNGREWLARQLDAAGVSYLRHDKRHRCRSKTCKHQKISANASPIGPGRGFSTRSPGGSNLTYRQSSKWAFAAPTGRSTRPRSPPT